MNTDTVANLIVALESVLKNYGATDIKLQIDPLNIDDPNNIVFTLGEQRLNTKFYDVVLYTAEDIHNLFPDARQTREVREITKAISGTYFAWTRGNTRSPVSNLPVRF